MSDNGTNNETIDNDTPSKPHLEPVPVRDRKRLMTISVPPALFAAIDTGAAAIGKTRSRFVCDMLVEAMELVGKQRLSVADFGAIPDSKTADNDSEKDSK